MVTSPMIETMGVLYAIIAVMLLVVASLATYADGLAAKRRVAGRRAEVLRTCRLAKGETYRLHIGKNGNMCYMPTPISISLTSLDRELVRLGYSLGR